MSDADRADRIAELKGRMAVFLRWRKQAHDAGDREKETALQAQIAELDKQAEQLQPQEKPGRRRGSS